MKNLIVLFLLQNLSLHFVFASDKDDIALPWKSEAVYSKEFTLDEKRGRRALKYVLEIDRILVHDITEFLSRKGDRSFPSGVKFLHRISKKHGEPPTDHRVAKIEVKMMTKDGSQSFDWGKYEKVEVWKRPLGELRSGGAAFIGIGWREEDGKPELIEGVVFIRM